MRLIVVTILASLSFASAAFSDSCLERFEFQQRTTTEGIVNKVGEFITDKSNKALGRHKMGKLLVLANKIKNEEVSFPETMEKLEEALIYGNMAKSFLKFKDYEALEGMSNIELAEKMIQVDSDRDPLKGDNPFCKVSIRTSQRRAGQEKFKMRIFNTNKKRIVRALMD